MRAARSATAGAVSMVVLLAGACSGGTSPAVSPSPVGDSLEQLTEVDWPTASPREVGLRPRALDAGARRARRVDSTCFAVVREGKLVGDWNWGMEPTEPREVFSVTKSVTSALVGIAIHDGDLQLDDRVSDYVPAWRGTASEGVSVRNLLSNDSGRFWSLESDYQRLISARSRTRYAMGLPQQHAPGTTWAYNNAAIQVLEPVLEAATGMPVAQLAEERLFEPLGMTHTQLVTDSSDDSAMVFYGMQTTCLDLARFGQLYLGRGSVGGTRLIGRDYVEQSVGRPSTVHNAAYGFLWWLNRPGLQRGATDQVDALGQPTAVVTGSQAPFAPADLFAAVGLGGQVLMVDPGSGTILVRLGRPAGLGGQAYDFADAARVLTRALR